MVDFKIVKQSLWEGDDLNWLDQFEIGYIHQCHCIVYKL
jgi:hypothetical protein